jgi:PhnB protein
MNPAEHKEVHEMPVEYKPKDYHTVTPYLIVDGAAQLIEFMVDVLGGTEMLRLPGPDGRLGHAEVRVGDSVVMLADASTPGDVMPAMLHLYVEDSDALYKRAIERGAASLREPKTEFYGDRMAGVQDALGNKWYFATHVEDVSDEEMTRRAAELAASAS